MKKKVLKTRPKSPKHDPELAPAGDLETIQAVVLAAAISGDQAIRAQLPAVLPAFEEPYRTAAAKIVSETADGGFLDKRTIERGVGGLPPDSLHCRGRRAAGDRKGGSGPPLRHRSPAGAGRGVREGTAIAPEGKAAA